MEEQWPIAHFFGPPIQLVSVWKRVGDDIMLGGYTIDGIVKSPIKWNFRIIGGYELRYMLADSEEVKPTATDEARGLL